jgi:hypothetical protein
MKKAIRNKTDGLIVINGMQGAVLRPRAENKYLIIDTGPSDLVNPELLALERDGIIEIIDGDKISSPAAEPVPVTKGTKGKKRKKKSSKTPEESINDASGSEVTIMTAEGLKKGNMKFSAAGEAAQTVKPPPDPEMLDLDKY